MTTTLKPSYGSAVALTFTSLASLANDSTNLLAGASSAVVDNTSNLSVDELVTGVIKMGTSPTAGNTIEVRAWSILDDTPTYPDTITGSDAAITLTSANTKNAGAIKLGAIIPVDATTSRLYAFSFSLAQLFGGFVPKKWGIWIVNGSGATLASSGSVVSHTPIQYQNV